MSELLLEHEPFTDDEGIRYCACGCGEALKPDAKRTYIHGHLKRLNEDGPIGDDPEPSEDAKAKGTVRVTAKIKKEMEESIAGYLALGAGAWAMNDPLCANALLDQSEQIAAKLVPILSRNQTVVRYFRSSSTFKDTMDLLIVLWPVAQMVGRHHIFHSVGTVKGQDGQHQQVNLNSFVA